MDLAQLLKEISTYKKNINLSIKLLQEISSLEQDRIANLKKILTKLHEFKGIIDQIRQSTEETQNLSIWADQYLKSLETTKQEHQKRLGVELEQELKKQGRSLSGQYPELKSGLFTIELDFDKEQATLWYDPKQERLDQCRLLAVEMANCIERVSQQLGSHLSEDELLKKLWEAYSRAAGSGLGEPVPITTVLVELAHLLQSPQFYQDPRRENYSLPDIFSACAIDPQNLEIDGLTSG